MTSVVDVKNMLDQISDLQSHRDGIAIEKKMLIDNLIPAEVRAQISEVEAEFEGKSEAIGAEIERLQDLVKPVVIEFGTTIKGAYLMAVCSSGRTSWDTKSLDGYAVAHPEILTLRHQGSPSVSFRKV